MKSRRLLKVYELSSSVYIIVTPFFPSPNNWRGAYCFDFVVALKRTGRYQVEVFVPGDGDDYQIGEVRVHRFVTRQLPSNILPFLWSGWNKRSFISAVKRVGIEFDRIAVCHANTANFAIYPLVLKRLCINCLALLHHHDLASFGLNLGILHRCTIYNAFLFGQLRNLHEQIDVHVFISEASRRSFLAAPEASWTKYYDYRAQMRGLKLFGCRPAKIKAWVVLHNGVDEKIFRRIERVESKERHRDNFVIGCIGNFGELKDQMTLLVAVDILCRTAEYTKYANGEKIKVVFIGSGEMLEECRRFAEVKELDVEFRTEVRHECLPDFYREIDLFVLPSYFEGFGCVFTESWACGTPFITCEGQGMDDMIYKEDRELWLCKVRNPKDLAAKIKNYIDNRPVQRLRNEIDINKLVMRFIDQIGDIRTMQNMQNVN